MKRVLLPAILLYLHSIFVLGQDIEVPSHMECVGIDLHFSEALRKEIQSEVDALAGNPKYFQIKLKRAQQYFPIIERILREENVPDDIKYLALQESALIADAVSSANAVGFWQFKIPAAQEVGLQINQFVDERMNIVASTRGAAKYLKSNNFYFNNWIYAVLSYNTGRGGADNYVNRKYFGAKRMDLGKETHWYVRKFIAHKIVFENKMRQLGRPEITLSEFTRGGGKTLNQIAKEFDVEPDELSLYNKWLKSSRIPEGRTYAVIIPGTGKEKLLASNNLSTRINPQNNPSPNMSEYPVIKQKKNDNSRIIKINGIPGVIAKEDEDSRKLASLGAISLGKFLSYNDMDISNPVIAGHVYYFRHKHNKAKEYFHTVLPGQSLWQISQKYGIKLRKLLAKNRIEGDKDIKPGMVLWIRYIRPRDQEIQYVPVPENPQPEIVLNQAAVKKEKTSALVEKSDSIHIDSLASATSPIETIQRDTVILSPPPMHKDTVVAITDKSDSVIAELPLFHLVQQGETVYSLSRKYNISVDTLMALNDIPGDASIRIGQQLYLREPPAEIETSAEKIHNPSEPYTFYEVLKGDTMYNIARKFNVTVEDIQEWNNKASFELKIGEFLKIYKR